MIIVSNNIISNPVVSVILTTYNHEKTIGLTIDNILKQNGNFSFELIIGEDAGTDGTRGICIDYQKVYPEKIKLLLQDSNQGQLKNFIDTIRLCRGKYIAFCSGDDYWMDDQKIAKQIRFLEKNPDYGVVSTSGYKLLVKRNKFIKGTAPLHPVADGNVFDKTWAEEAYAMPSSLLIKAEMLQYVDFDEFIKRGFPAQHMPLQAILAKQSKFGHIPDYCCVTRVDNHSMSFANFDSPRYMAYHEGLVEVRRYLAELYSADVKFSEQWASDYLGYHRFLKAVNKFDYLQAKKELTALKFIDKANKNVLKLTKSRLGFMIFCYVKRRKSDFHK